MTRWHQEIGLGCEHNGKSMLLFASGLVLVRELVKPSRLGAWLVEVSVTGGRLTSSSRANRANRLRATLERVFKNPVKSLNVGSRPHFDILCATSAHLCCSGEGKERTILSTTANDVGFRVLQRANGISERRVIPEPPGRQNKAGAGFLYGTINVRYKFTNYTNLDSSYLSKTNGPLGQKKDF
ncbi:hypothetical protein CSKR_102006 [Clonorchis sinensis]|uniref:Uncharacterized protein n=1 Tax=Clonorchis sinensis TaxID=79923 RepID=A0A419QC29_CLOSI|nr:hypothetical protein CSKR_102006 [Clonorchis sinensis]